jgi:hypothetical protein
MRQNDHDGGDINIGSGVLVVTLRNVKVSTLPGSCTRRIKRARENAARQQRSGQLSVM